MSQRCLDEIRLQAHSLLTDCPKENTVIRGLWEVGCFFKPTQIERLFQYRFVVAQVMAQGAAYCSDLSSSLSQSTAQDLIGRSLLDYQVHDTCLELALLDALCAARRPPPNATHTLRGNSIDKATQRATLICKEALRLAAVVARRPRIANIGVVGLIASELQAAGCDVLLSDLDPHLIGSSIGRVKVQHGSDSPSIVAQSDVAIVSGMALTTGTLDDILTAGRLSGCKIVIFAETDSSFANIYIRLGASAVIAEPFPFYIFQGTTDILIYRAQ